MTPVASLSATSTNAWVTSCISASVRTLRRSGLFSQIVTVSRSRSTRTNWNVSGTVYPFGPTRSSLFRATGIQSVRLTLLGRLLGRILFAQIVVDQGEEQLQVQRLREVLVRPGVAESSDLARRRVGRQHHDRDVGSRGVGAKSLQHVESVDVGQVHVEQDQVRVADLGDADAGTALDRGQELDIGTLEQEAFDQLHVVEIVFDVKDRCHDGSSTLVSLQASYY